MYSKHQDVYRTHGLGWTVQLNTTKFCQRLGIRPGRLREYFQVLQQLGVLRHFNWEGRRAIVRLAVPYEWEGQ